MTNEEAIRELKADYCGNRIICELYPDQCNREDCEIWWAINALENAKNDNLTPESSQNVPNQAFKMQKSYVRSNTISRRAVIETVRDADVCVCYSENESVEIENVIDLAIRATKGSVIASIEQLPSAHQTLYGYDIEHLKLIANILQKENLPPERVADALMDIGRIVVIVGDEYRETLRKAVEQCRI